MNVNLPNTRRARTVRLSLLGLALGGAIVGGIALAGPLNPPAGPVTSTYKTLTEVEPRIAINATNTPGDADSLFKITQPGSYYLTGNITGVVGKHGIELAASGVTLDLSGFDLVGVPGSLDGASATVGVNNVTVRHGSLRSWGDEGLDFTNGSSIVVEGVSVLTCAGFGISVNTNSTVSHCRVSSNGAGGIATGSNCLVTGCAAHGNTGAGGILAFVGCRVVDCAAFANTGNGISAQNGSTITGCSSTSNSASGFSVNNGCTITNCSASGNDTHGFSGADGVTISGCSASSNFGSGIVVANGGAISSCTARSNAVDGIVGNNFTTISSCSVIGNTGDGIEVLNRCYVFANQCGGTINAPVPNTTGIHAGGTGNRIEANVLTGNARGLDIDSAGNLIIRNTATGNTINWDISATNRGQFVIAIGGGAAFAGSTGGAPVGSTDPWVNFSY